MPNTGRQSSAGATWRAVLYQAALVVLLAGIVWFMVDNTIVNMRARGIQSGFDFLRQAAGFDIGETLLPFSSVDSYARAFGIGLLNTLRVALTGIVLASLIGLVVGIGRLSTHPMVRALSTAYVEGFRNVPLLLQLLIWYVGLTEHLPPPAQPLQWANLFFMSKSGLQMPAPLWNTTHALTLIGLAIGAVAATAYWRRARRQTQAASHSAAISAGIVLTSAIAAWCIGRIVTGATAAWQLPELGAFNVSGGLTLTPEFLAALLALSFYTAAFIAEIVRAALQSVPRTQLDAARALGLVRTDILAYVQLPQALRVMIPPLTSQYLNLIKNSSLAVAVGYPELVSIANTSLNQTGRAFECIAIVMGVYLSLSLLTAALMNGYNRAVAFRER